MHMLSTEKYVSDLYKFKRGNKPSYMSAQEMKKKKKKENRYCFSNVRVLGASILTLL